MTHSFHVGHSYSDRGLRIFPYSLPGEYDDRYDLMSTSNAMSYSTVFGLSGPGLIGPHLDYLGWLPMHRHFYFGIDGRSELVIRLSSLSIPHWMTTDWLLILLPYDRDEPMNVYTVEFRTPHFDDQGLTNSVVIIHQVKRQTVENYNDSNGNFYSYIVTHQQRFYELTRGTEWVKFIEQTNNYIKIGVKNIDSKRNTADIHIVSTFDSTFCAVDEKFIVESGKKICMPIRSDNLSFWEVVNRQMKRRNFYRNLRTWGQNSCLDGLVWRALDPYDYVCVTAKRRMEARIEDELDLKHRNRTSAQCFTGFVPRQAFRKDKICVIEKQRLTAMLENATAKQRLRFYGFFNGKDPVDF